MATTIVLVAMWLNGQTTFWSTISAEECIKLQEYVYLNSPVKIAKCMPEKDARALYDQMMSQKVEA